MGQHPAHTEFAADHESRQLSVEKTSDNTGMDAETQHQRNGWGQLRLHWWLTMLHLVLGLVTLMTLWFTPGVLTAESVAHRLVGIIMVCILLDMADGWVARRTGQTSPAGRWADALADAVSFGLVPTTTIWVLAGSGTQQSWLGWLAGSSALLYLLAAWARLLLAGFRNSTRADFTGLPTPAAAIMLVSLSVLLPNWIQLPTLGLACTICAGAMWLPINFRRGFRLRPKAAGLAFALASVLAMIAVSYFQGSSLALVGLGMGLLWTGLAYRKFSFLTAVAGHARARGR